jgi:hypothetical protein
MSDRTDPFNMNILPERERPPRAEIPGPIAGNPLPGHSDDGDESGGEVIEIEIDGKPWHCAYEAEYDAAPAVAGALLAGTEEIVITREGGD